MSLFRWLKKESLEFFPVFLFFAISFVITNISEQFILRGTNISDFTLLEVIIAAAVISKVLFLIDKMPWVDLFPKKPLIWNVCWKSIIYWVIILIVRVSVRFSPFIFTNASVVSDAVDFSAEMSWYLFSVIQLIYLGIFFEFALTREAILKIGPLKLRKMFFGF